uniref:ATP synthase F0 subunit 8 n=1 Tax=Scolytinae sp. BMNH 1040118 TaxID=1903784 RepID=A0A343A5Z2_9CUCU|nr:ATP synthase F0 subunit 8 [Scolytinae sp. BMNH 1040118]
MPQMAPMNWMLLYSLFSVMLLMTMTIMFFQFLQTSPYTENKKKSIQTNWKW